MDYKALAAEIYALPHHRRLAALQEYQPGDRGMIRAYMDQLAKRAQDENRKRNAVKGRRQMDFICGGKK